MLTLGSRVVFVRENQILKGWVYLNGMQVGELFDVPQHLMGINGSLSRYISALAQTQGLMAVATEVVAEFDIILPFEDERIRRIA